MVNGADHLAGDHAQPVPPNVTVKFVVPYETKWGEILLLTGPRGLLGGGTIDKAPRMSCCPRPCGLLWETSLVVPDQYASDYQYVVYNEHSNHIVKWESSLHRLKVPASMAGSCLLITDHFTASHLSLLMCYAVVYYERGRSMLKLSVCRLGAHWTQFTNRQLSRMSSLPVILQRAAHHSTLNQLLLDWLLFDLVYRTSHVIRLTKA